MPSPPTAATLDAPVLEQWRDGGGHLTFKEVAWTGAATALILHASLHFFSAALDGLDRFLVAFVPPERLALGLTHGINPLGTWFLLTVTVAVWGALIGVALLGAARELAVIVRRVFA